MLNLIKQYVVSGLIFIFQQCIFFILILNYITVSYEKSVIFYLKINALV
jgi:hypothetical protein